MHFTRASVVRCSRELNQIRLQAIVRGLKGCPQFSIAIISQTVQLWIWVFWVFSVQFNIRNTLPKFGPFHLLHPVCIHTVIPWNPNLIRSRTPFEFQIVRFPRKFFPFKIAEIGLICSRVPQTRIFKIILTVNTLDFKVKY